MAVQHGERTDPWGKAVQNKMLLSVPNEEYELIRPHLEFGIFPQGQRLHEPHRTLEFIYFPNQGLISLVVELKDGKSVGIFLLGNEGVVGMAGALGLIRSPLQEIVQVAGNGFRIRIGTLKKILQGTPTLQTMLSRYAAGIAMQIGQTAACNRWHNVEKRLARWLLIAHDRLDCEIMPITQGFLGTMLGTDRASVSITARMLKELRIIAYSRGAITILNRKQLEELACECYAVIRQYHV
jgi:CRP-like cAMP-binding protein